MKIVSFPSTSKAHSHIIPLFVLHQRYFSEELKVKNYFILDESEHKKFDNTNLKLIKMYSNQSLPSDNKGRIDHDIVVNRIKEVFDYVKDISADIKPDLIFDDLEPFSTLMGEKQGIPRVSIYRTGYFRSLDMEFRNPSHLHSFEKSGRRNIINWRLISDPQHEVSQRILEYFKNTIIEEDINIISKYLSPKTKLIPGIKTIERLPEDVENPESYFYTGPLLMEDNPTELLMKDLKLFLVQNRSKQIVFITMGLVDVSDVYEMIEYLLKKGYAVVTTSKISKELVGNTSFYSNSFLPLNYICRISDLIIHHCGSGMYHYPILNLKPFITLGTQCFDREDVAITLQNLGVSRHVPSKYDSDQYFEIFKSFIDLHETDSLTDYKILLMLREEIYDTMLKFNIEEVYNYTLNK